MTATAAAPSRTAGFAPPRVSGQQALAAGIFALLVVGLALPLLQVVWRSITDSSGAFVGLANYDAYFRSPALSRSLGNTLTVSATAAVVACGVGLLLAYGATRARMPIAPAFIAIAMLPLYAPTLLHGIGLIYLFGNQGLITTGFFGALPGWKIPLYGQVGVTLALTLACVPYALLIFLAALRNGDGRLYEAAHALGASPLRTFWTVTLPSLRYAATSAFFVCFATAFTDFGAPKVVGGNFNVLATDVYKQVVGQQNLNMGAVVAVLLLLPAVFAFAADQFAQRRQTSSVSSRSTPVARSQSFATGAAFGLVGAGVAVAVLLVMGVSVLASFIRNWPYRLELTLANYEFTGFGAGGWDAFGNSIWMALLTALCGATATFLAAYVVSKCRGAGGLRLWIAAMAVAPAAVPGLVLGLAYIFFFNQPAWQAGPVAVPNPFEPLYGTMAILVLCNVVHFFAVGYATSMAALSQLDPDIETVGYSLGAPFTSTLARVTIPVSLPAIADVALYFFVNAMTTVSAVIFLYSSGTRLASVAVVNLEETGDTAKAAGMAALIVAANIAAFALLRTTMWLAARRSRTAV